MADHSEIVLLSVSPRPSDGRGAGGEGGMEFPIRLPFVIVTLYAAMLRKADDLFNHAIVAGLLRQRK
jgi:hypothetical protein